jgi:hypothetical protein
VSTEEAALVDAVLNVAITKPLMSIATISGGKEKEFPVAANASTPRTAVTSAVARFKIATVSKCTCKFIVPATLLVPFVEIAASSRERTQFSMWKMVGVLNAAEASTLGNKSGNSLRRNEPCIAT